MTAAELREKSIYLDQIRRDVRGWTLNLANMELPRGMAVKAVADGVIFLESLAALEADLRAEVERIEQEPADS